jgi:hypothetical protein
MSKNETPDELLPIDADQYRFIAPEAIIFPTPADGDGETVKVAFSAVPPAMLQTLAAEENARFMTADQMRRLASNLKKDNAITSAVLVYPDAESRKLVVLSGNHRVEAALLAGQQLIPVMVIQSYLTEERKLAIQLSHNAITGQDDPNILGKLYESLTLEYKAYSGLTDDSFNILEKLDIDSLAIGTPQYEEILLQFLPADKEAFMSHLERLAKPKEKRTYLLAEYEDYSRLFDAIVAVKQFKNIFNTAVAIRALADLAIERLQQLEAEAEAEPNADAKET